MPRRFPTRLTLPRQAQLRVLWVLNELLPPVLRDARWVMAPLLRVVFGRHAGEVASFKDRAAAMSDEEYVDLYRRILADLPAERSDLTAACLEEVLGEVVGSSVLEVGCGPGALAVRLAASHDVTACDIVLDASLATTHPEVHWQECNIERLPFDDGAFDTVVCTHTLEHVRQFESAVSELRRVARRRVVIVVPKERPYRYTFNLHLRFFPYEHSFLNAVAADRRATCRRVGSELLYTEDSGGVASG